MSLTLLIGGARSGKSSLAVDIGHRHQAAGTPVSYLATATALDDDMSQRITHHRRERPAEWVTIEEPLDVAGAVASAGDGLVIIDCLTLWTSNLMLQGASDEEIRATAHDTARIVADRVEPTVAITNEVGLGVHPETELGRRYRDVLGRVNQSWASAADPALLLVAGRALTLTDPWDHL